jgi:hypothetical protein
MRKKILLYGNPDEVKGKIIVILMTLMTNILKS